MHMLSLHPEVYNELEFARQWYSDKSIGLGIEFLDEIDLALESIQASPEIWPTFVWVPGTRHFLVHRFPFGVFYRLSNDRIQVLAIGHLHRKPGYWKSRM